MPKRTPEFHPEAVEEARAARAWYAARSLEAAGRFMAELDLALEQIAESPDRFALYLGGTRGFLLRRFPYLIVFRETESTVQVVAVAHGRRKPGYWKSRLRS
jgi:plasmid stabilization system protein ParE